MWLYQRYYMEMRDYGDGILKCVVISVLLLPPRRENVRLSSNIAESHFPTCNSF